MIISNLSIPLVGIVDTTVMGHLDSPNYLAAVGAGAQIFAVIFLGFNFLRMSSTGLAAQAFGSKDTRLLRSVLGQGIITAIALGMVLMLLQRPILDGAMAWFAPETALESVIGQYFSIRIWSAPFTLCNYVLVGWLLGLHMARSTLLVLLAINLTNIVLDIVFVLVFDWRAEGVALASFCAEVVGFLVGLWVVYRALHKNPGSWPQSLFVWSEFKSVFALNTNILLRTLALMFSFAFMTAQSTRLGTVILAANTVLLNFQTFMAYALDGFANAAEALVGKAIGEKQQAALDRAVRVCLQWSLGVALMFVGLFAALGDLFVDGMTGLESVRQMAKDYLVWIIVLPLISVWSFLYDGVYVGATRGAEMRNIMLISTFGVFVPAWFMFSRWDNHGLWLAFSAFMASRAILMHWTYQKLRSEGVLIHSR